MKKSFVLIGALSIFSLVGCEETKSVDWWLEHHEESLKKKKLSVRKPEVTARIVEM